MPSRLAALMTVLFWTAMKGRPTQPRNASLAWLKAARMLTVLTAVSNKMSMAPVDWLKA